MQAALGAFAVGRLMQVQPCFSKLLKGPSAFVLSIIASLPDTEQGNMNISDTRKKIISAGWLAICVISIFNKTDAHFHNGQLYTYWGTPSISWLVLLCATWALIVALFPQGKIDVKRCSRLRRKREQRKWRLQVAELLSKNFLDEKVFETILNNGKQNSLVSIPPGCAQKGWRGLSTVHLIDSATLLQHFLRDRVSSIARLEKLIRKGVTNEEYLLDLAKAKRAGVNDWRSLNWAELKVVIALVTKDPRDYRNAIGH